MYFTKIYNCSFVKKKKIKPIEEEKEKEKQEKEKQEKEKQEKEKQEKELFYSFIEKNIERNINEYIELTKYQMSYLELLPNNKLIKIIKLYNRNTQIVIKIMTT